MLSAHSTIADDSDQLEEHASVKQLMTNAEQGGSVTLEQCFEVRQAKTFTLPFLSVKYR